MNIIDKIKEKAASKKLLFSLLCVFIVIFLVTTVLFVINFVDYLAKLHSEDGVVISVSENNDNSFGNYSYEIEFYDYYDNYTSSIVSSNKVYDIDDYVKVYYRDPSKIYLNRRNPAIIIIPTICLGVIVVLLFLLRDNHKETAEEKEKKKLLNSKNTVYARIDDVICKERDNKRYYSIVCSWDDPKDNKNYKFYSEELDFDPTMSIRVSNKNSLNVHLDKNNYDNYVVDVNDIKNNRI